MVVLIYSLKGRELLGERGSRPDGARGYCNLLKLRTSISRYVKADVY